MKKVSLPEDYTAVLRFITRTGQEELGMLIETLRIDRARLLHIIQSLQHKGLILVRRTRHSSWIRLSAKGWRVSAALAYT